jgi:hypothetical protein
MSNSRKPLAIALTLVIMLAMLVPVAMAAPEWVHGVTITAPTGAAPAYVNPDAGKSVNVTFTVPVVGTQVDNVWIGVHLLSKYLPDGGNDAVKPLFTIIPANTLKTGDNNLTAALPVNDAAAGGELEDGWYNLKVCVMDVDWGRDLFCDTQVNAVLVQDTYPVVDLEKPGVEEWQGATFVMGDATNPYLMVGTAVDDWGIAAVEFQYCDKSNAPGCFKDSPSWIKIADGVPTPGVPNQWQSKWDSTAVPDDFGYIRMCATNLVGLSNCKVGLDPEDATRSDKHLVFVNNRFPITLEPGWNLVSTPLIPYKPAIADVLMHLIAHGTVKSVWAYDPTAVAPAPKWTSWVPGGPSTLTMFRDGRGYWIEMAAEDKLDFIGAWKSVGAITPPQYGVKVDWNLLGYTHWGRPTIFPPKEADDYLAGVGSAATALYRYDATSETYYQVFGSQHMTLGAGYWLASTKDATIYP